MDARNIPSTKASTPIDPALYTPDEAAPAPLPAMVPPVAKIATFGRDLKCQFQTCHPSTCERHLGICLRCRSRSLGRNLRVVGRLVRHVQPSRSDKGRVVLSSFEMRDSEWRRRGEGRQCEGAEGGEHFGYWVGNGGREWGLVGGSRVEPLTESLIYHHRTASLSFTPDRSRQLATRTPT